MRYFSTHASGGPNARKRRMPNKRSGENEYRVTGSVLDELGLDRQAALELNLKAALHQNILQLVKRRGGIMRAIWNESCKFNSRASAS